MYPVTVWKVCKHCQVSRPPHQFSVSMPEICADREWCEMQAKMQVEK